MPCCSTSHQARSAGQITRETRILRYSTVRRHSSHQIAAEEAAGLYEDTTTIGFLMNWQKLLASKGATYQGHQLILHDREAAPEREAAPTIDRPKTALTRFEFSQPVKTLFEHGLLKPGMTVFDYGCGPGSDVADLAGLGFEATRTVTPFAGLQYCPRAARNLANHSAAVLPRYLGSRERPLQISQATTPRRTRNKTKATT